jgi:hypothetical protein
MYIVEIESIESGGVASPIPVNNDPAVGDSNMSSISVGMYLNQCQVTLVLNLDFFD